LETTTSIPISQDKQKSSIILGTTGRTPRDTRIKIDRKISDTLNVSKNTVVLIGEDLAKQDIYNILDVFYRNAKGSLNARLAVTEEKASKTIRSSLKQDKIPNEYLNHLLINAEKTDIVIN